MQIRFIYKKNMDIFIFDTETSGLSPYSNVILQLSYQIVDSDSWIIQKKVNHYFPWPKNKRKVSQEAIAINGLTEEFLNSKQLSDRKTALEEFIEDKETCDLVVAHNLEFDKEFIIASCQEEGVKYANSGWSPSYDTMKKTANYCQIPKENGYGYKWPKLSELADCLGVKYYDIPLHDSEGDVELTKRCLRELISMDVCKLPKGLELKVKLNVISPDNIWYDVTDYNGKRLCQSDIDCLPKRKWNALCQKLIKNWSEENDAKRKEITHIYQKTIGIKDRKQFENELAWIIPSKHKYVRKEFTELGPSKSQLRKQLEHEAEQNVSTWKFWTLKKKREEYVESHIDEYYQKLLNEYEQRLAQHEKAEDAAEEEYNQIIQRECKERKDYLTAIIEGERNAVEKELKKALDNISIPVPLFATAHFEGNTVNVNLTLPRPGDMPQMEGMRMASGNYKIKALSEKDRISDYSECVLGLAAYVAPCYFNVSPAISAVNIDGSVSIPNYNQTNLHLYNILFERTAINSLDFGNMEIEQVLSPFNVTNNISKQMLDILFVPKGK